MTDLDKSRQIINDIDRKMMQLFEQRMDAVRQIAEYKRQHNLPVDDVAREAELFCRNVQYLENKNNQPYYAGVWKSMVEQSKRLQRDLRDEMHVATSEGGYRVIIQRGGLHRVGEWFDLVRKVLVVSDTGVPEEYVMTVASQCDEAIIFIFEQGEQSKCIDTYKSLLQTLVDNRFTRSDCVVAVGGGVVGDMAGFAAATYMRGVDFYNVPTTLLAQVDASIGGKTAIDFGGYKNIVGAFYPPKCVLVDVDVLQMLPKRQVANGMAEVLKMALTHDAELFSALEMADDISEDTIRRALSIKKLVIEEDEYESGLRKVLNFGHTLGHAIESVSENYLHGECVALGILPMCAQDVRDRVLQVFEKWELPTMYKGDVNVVLEASHHDKKAGEHDITIVVVPQIGTFELKTISFTEYEQRIREVMGE